MKYLPQIQKRLKPGIVVDEVKGMLAAFYIGRRRQSAWNEEDNDTSTNEELAAWVALGVAYCEIG